MIVIYEIFRWFGLLTGWPVQFLFFKRKTYYEDKKAQGRMVKGGAMVISNHYNVLDYVANVFLFPFRKLHVVYAETSNKWAILGMNFFGGIPVNRDSYHMPFLRTCVRLLKKGRLIQIYPEAHISRDGTMLPFKPSYIYMALQAGVPILPVIIDGNYGPLKRAHVIVGKMINPADYCAGPRPTREEIMAINDMIQAKCHELKVDLDARVARDSGKKRRKDAHK